MQDLELTMSDGQTTLFIVINHEKDEWVVRATAAYPNTPHKASPLFKKTYNTPEGALEEAFRYMNAVGKNLPRRP